MDLCICMAGGDWVAFGASIKASLDASASRGTFNFPFTDLIVCITVHKEYATLFPRMTIWSIMSVSGQRYRFHATCSLLARL